MAAAGQQPGQLHQADVVGGVGDQGDSSFGGGHAFLNGDPARAAWPDVLVPAGPGYSAMKVASISVHSASSRSTTWTPCSATQSWPPTKLAASPMTTVPIWNWRSRPLQYQHGRRRGHHHAVGVVTPASGGPEGGGLAVHGRVVVLDPAVVAPPEQGPVAMEEGGADGDTAFGQAEPSLLEGDGEERGGPWPGSAAHLRTSVTAARVMSMSAARTYPTTVGSQSVDLPLVALTDELSIALLICVDLGVHFAEVAGRELADLMRPARPEIIVSVATMGIPLAIEASRALGFDDYVILHKTPKIHLGETWAEPVSLHHDREAATPAHGSRPGPRRPGTPGGGGRRRDLDRRLHAGGAPVGAAHRSRAGGHRHADDRGLRVAHGPGGGRRERLFVGCHAAVPSRRARQR